MRAHRVAAAVWAVGGAAVMYLMALALVHEMDTFPGGPAGLAASVMPGAEAMRPLRWPAERLDTLGGYLTYHNVTLYTFLLCVYAAVVGARAVRGSESDSSLEEVLATGWSRAALVRDRALGFLALLMAITLGVGLGIAAAMAAGDQPDFWGSLVTVTASALAAFTAYGLAVLVSQLVRSPRTAAGISALLLAVLYVVNNVWDEVGPLGAVRFVSPFHYADQSRALVPGHGLDIAAMTTLLAAAVVLLCVAAWAFRARDYGAPLWSWGWSARGPEEAPRAWTRSRVLGTLWTAILARGWVGLLAWTGSVVAWIALIMAMQPAVMDAWTSFGFTEALAGGSPGEQYLGFAGELLVPIIAGYVVTAAAGWLRDLEEGRVEAVLSAPVSWPRLVGERLLAVLVGVAVLIASALATMVVGASVLGSDVSSVGLARLGAVCLLFGMAVAAVAALLVAWLRSAVAVTALAVYLGVAYLLTLLVPMLDWPEWLTRASVLWAFGHPYLEWPTAAGFAVLLVIAVPGALVAASIAARTPKCA